MQRARTRAAAALRMRGGTAAVGGASRADFDGSVDQLVQLVGDGQDMARSGAALDRERVEQAGAGPALELEC